MTIHCLRNSIILFIIITFITKFSNLSIIEQTASNFRDILKLPKDSQVVFEHHSNLVEPEDEASEEIRKLIDNYKALKEETILIIDEVISFIALSPLSSSNSMNLLGIENYKMFNKNNKKKYIYIYMKTRNI